MSTIKQDVALLSIHSKHHHSTQSLISSIIRICNMISKHCLKSMVSLSIKLDFHLPFAFKCENFNYFALSFPDYHIVGCGDKTVSVWDHRNGNLLIDFEIDLPTIGQNIGCYTFEVDVSGVHQKISKQLCVCVPFRLICYVLFDFFQNPEYMLLVQLVSVPQSDKNCDNQLKLMAVQTVDPYNWRTLQTHDIPNQFGK